MEKSYHLCVLKTWRPIVISTIFGVFVFLLVLEIYLRVMSPIALRLHGDKIQLARNVTWVVHNDKIPGIDKEVIHHRNSLGFRGAEPDLNSRGVFSILTVGGSTTECFYLSEGKTWPDRLYRDLQSAVPSLWLNNAGLDGHSTFGHIILLKDYVVDLRPDMVFFLIGLNDMERDDLNSFDQSFANSQPSHALQRVFSASYALSFLRNLARSSRAWRTGLSHTQLDLKAQGTEPDVPPEQEKRLFITQRVKYLPGYNRRLQELIRLCREHGIKPVLITQPALYGSGIDPVTGVNLERIRYKPGRNGRLAWQLLELYNDETRAVARENRIPIVDLAVAMPKSSRYYYDFHHFTVDGAEKVAELIAAAVKPELMKK